MPLDLAILANDCRQVSQDLPVSFRFRSKQYDGASFNPGELGFDPVAGGIIEDVGTATLMLPVADLPKRPPEEDEDLKVLWHGHWVEFIVRSILLGHAVATITLETPAKS